MWTETKENGQNTEECGQN